MPTLIEQQILEIQGALSTLRPILEGFRDLQRALLDSDGPEVMQEVSETINDFVKRESQLQAALATLTALATAGYPAKVPVIASALVAAKLQEQVMTINAAFAEVTVPPEAQSAAITVEGIGPVV